MTDLADAIKALENAQYLRVNLQNLDDPPTTEQLKIISGFIDGSNSVSTGCAKSPRVPRNGDGQVRLAHAVSALPCSLACCAFDIEDEAEARVSRHSQA